jgi:hypothetical protein
MNDEDFELEDLETLSEPSEDAPSYIRLMWARANGFPGMSEADIRSLEEQGHRDLDEATEAIDAARKTR